MLISKNILEFINPKIKKISNSKISDIFNILGLEIDEQNWVYDIKDYEKLVFGKILHLEKLEKSKHLTLCTVILWNGKLKKFIEDSQIKIICGANNLELNSIVIVSLEGQFLPNGIQIKKRQILGITSNAMICSLEELGIKKNGYQKGIFYIWENGKIFSKFKKGFFKNPIDLFNDYYWNVSTIFNSHFLQNQYLLTNLILWLYSIKNKRNIRFDNDLSDNLKRFQGNFIQKSDKFHISTKNKNIKGKLFRLETKRVKELFSFLDLKILSSLIHLGYNLVNQVVDYVNLFSFIFGQPLHIYDEDIMLRKGLTVCKVKNPKTIIDFFNRKLKIEKDDFVIKREDDKIVALPSIIGTKEFQSLGTSKYVFLEVLYIPPKFINKTITRMNITTITSKMVEKHASYSTWIQAIYFFSGIKDPLDITNQIKVDNWWIKNNLNLDEKIKEKLWKILELFNIYEAFSNKIITLKGNYHWIKTQSDLIQFCYQLLTFFDYKSKTKNSKTLIESNIYETKADLIKLTLHFLGYTEVTPYLLSSENNSEYFNFQVCSQSEKIQVVNEINPYFKQIVWSLITPLLDILLMNKNYNEEQVDIYARENLPITFTSYSNRLAILSYSKISFSEKNFNRLYSTIRKILNFYDLEDMEFKMLKDLIVDKSNSNLHREVNFNNTQVIFINKKPIVIFGEIHPFLLMKYKINHGSTLFAEIYLDNLKNLKSRENHFKRLSRHPFITKEMTFLFKREKNFNEILKLIKNTFKEIEDVWIDKIYVDEKGISVSFKLLIFQKHTISSKELNSIFTNIYNLLKKTYIYIELKGQISVFK